MPDYRFSYEALDCPFCHKVISPSHVKRHIAMHHDVPQRDADIAWVRWLEAREEIAAENADAWVEIIDRRAE